MYTYWVTQKLPRICTVILQICMGRLRDLQYIFAVTSGSSSISELPSIIRTMGTANSLTIPDSIHTLRDKIMDRGEISEFGKLNLECV